MIALIKRKAVWIAPENVDRRKSIFFGVAKIGALALALTIPRSNGFMQPNAQLCWLSKAPDELISPQET